jgi:small subunit ribosomal protein S17
VKKFDGIVVSTKMEKTVVVSVSRKTPHPLYRKLIKRSKNYKVDPNGMDLIKGQQVRIIETKPISKGKYFKVDKILSKGKDK